MRAIIYLRVSTLMQKESGLGLKAQLKACKAIADRCGIKKKLVFEDQAVSGLTKIENRKGLTAALFELQKGDLFIVARRDRIARDTAIAIQVERIVEQCKATLVSAAGEGTDIQGALGLQLRRSVDVKAEVFRERVAQNTKISLYRRKENGKCIGKVPYGFMLSKNGKFVCICEYEQEIIKFAVSLRHKNYSFRAITEEINRRGYRSREGTPFGVSQIFRMCKAHGVDKKSEADVVAVVKQLRSQGMSLRAILHEINQQKYKSSAGKPFHLTQVVRMLNKQ